MGYPGGKGRLWQNIVSLMAPNDIYIETYIGSGALVRNKCPAKTTIGVDIDQRVIHIAAARNVPAHVPHKADGLTLLAERADDSNEVVYGDPLYVVSTKKNCRFYRHENADDDRCQLLEVPLKLHCCVMISGNPSTPGQQARRGW